jgi:nucleoside-diphosphate-sugar epimerase
MEHTHFVTGALGCIGAWIVEALLARGQRPFVFDLDGDRRRLLDLIEPEALEDVPFAAGDVTDAQAVRSALERSGARRVIHLAGLQVPTCKADPLLGARVNVLGTLNVLQAAAELEVERVVYASSAAVYGPSETDEVPDESSPCRPLTHYGVFKRANEGAARVFHADLGLSSVGLRPLTVYGVGRDQGLTSGPTSAMKAAVLGRPFRIGFSGATSYQYAPDVAAAFLACAERAPEGAHVFNLRGESADVARVIELVEEHLPAQRRGAITAGGPAIPIPAELDASRLAAAIEGLPSTPLAEGISRTMKRFTALRDAGRLDTSDLDAAG